MSQELEHSAETASDSSDSEAITMTLAVFDDGLAGVYPCSDGDRTWTVSDYLDTCEQAGTVIHYDSEAFPGDTGRRNS